MTRGDGDGTRELMVVPDADLAEAPAETADAGLLASRYTQRLRGTSQQDAEAAYVAARDGWTAAMKAAGSGRAADLASLAIAQEAYEAATAERERWMRTAPTTRRAIPVDAPGGTSEIDAVVSQEIGWRHVHDPRPARGLRGLVKRILGD